MGKPKQMQTLVFQVIITTQHTLCHHSHNVFQYS